MFCPQCGQLGFVDSANHMNCTGFKCGFSGSAENIIRIRDNEIDLSMVKTSTRDEQMERSSRDFNNPMPSFWAEPGHRLQSTQKRVCPKCQSSNLRIVVDEEECNDCGAHVP